MICLLFGPAAQTNGGGSAGMEGIMNPYTAMPTPQQLLAIEQSVYNADPFRQGLTPPQMPGDHMHPYGKRDSVSMGSLSICLCGLLIFLKYIHTGPKYLLNHQIRISVPRNISGNVCWVQKFPLHTLW